MSVSCSVCSGSKVSFNYGVLCCNACKMFFRRAVISSRPKICKTDGNCTKIENRTCRMCRFQWCLQAGMHAHNLQIFKNPEADFSKLSMFIDHLKYLDNYRKEVFYDFEIIGDFQEFGISLENAITGPINFKKSEKNSKKFQKWTCQEWDILEQITSIDFLKKMEFMQLLSHLDQGILLKETAYKFKVFAASMRNFHDEKSEKMSFPGGIDIFLQQVLENPGYSKVLLDNIRSRIIAKLMDLQVKNEEFLLIGVLFFCNPGIPSLSTSARSHITKYQQMYTSALFQYCLITYPNGPARFTDLLSICHVINATWTDITNFVTLFRCYQKELKLKAMLEDVIDVLEEEK